MAATQLEIKIAAQDSASNVLRSVQGGLKNVSGAATGATSALGGIGGALKNIVQQAAGFAAGAFIVKGIEGITSSITGGIKAAGDLQQSVANISTIKPDIDTSAVFGALNQMSTRIPQSAAALGESLYDVFSSMDVGATEGLAMVEQFARGATAAGTDAKTFGTSIMGVMNAYKLEVGDASKVSDMFFNTVNKGVVTGAELAGSLGMVTGSAKAAGVELPELMAMIAGVTKEGGPAAQNINNLNNFLSKFTTEDAQKGFQGLGIAVVGATGQLRSPMEVIGDLRGRLDKLTEAERLAAVQKIFPDIQARQGANVLMSQLEMVNATLAENQTAVGSTDAAYRKMASTFNSQTKILGNTFQSLMTTVGAKVLPLITPLIEGFAQRLPGAFEAAERATKPLFDALGRLGENLGRIAKYLSPENDYDLMRDWFGPDIGPKIDEVARGLKDIATAAGDILKPLLAGDWSGAATAFSNLKDQAWKGLMALGDLGGTLAGKIGEAVGNIDWAAAGAAAGKTIGNFTGAVVNAVQAVDWSGIWGKVWAGYEVMGPGEQPIKMPGLVPKLLGDASNLAGQLTSTLGEAAAKIDWVAIGAAAGKTVGNFFTGIGNLAGEVQKWAQSIDWSGFWARFWAGMGEGVKPQVQLGEEPGLVLPKPGALQELTAAIQAFNNSLKETAPEPVVDLFKRFEGMGDTVLPAMKRIMDRIGEVITKIGELYETWGKLFTQADEKMPGMKDVVETAFKVVEAQLRLTLGVAELLLAAISGIEDAFIALGKTLKVWTDEGIIGKIQGIINIVSSLNAGLLVAKELMSRVEAWERGGRPMGTPGQPMPGHPNPLDIISPFTESRTTVNVNLGGRSSTFSFRAGTRDRNEMVRFLRQLEARETERGYA